MPIIASRQRRPQALPPRGVILNGLVAYAPFWHPDLSRESSRTKDPNALTLTNSSSVWTPKGRTFNGSGAKVTLGHNAVIDSLSAVTVNCWFNPTTVPGGADWRDILNKGWNAEGSYIFYIDKSSAVINQYLFLDGAQRGGGTAVTAAVWADMTFTYDGSDMYCYVNGVQKWTVHYVKASWSNTTDLTIGGPSVDMDGTIGEISIYNRALSLAEVNANHLATKGRYTG